MFELIRAILEKIAESVSPAAIKRFVDDKRLADIGSELFLLYSSLNTILVTGRQIASLLRDAVATFERKRRAGDTDYVYLASDLGHLVPTQQSNLLRFSASLKRLGTGLQVIDGAAYRQIIPLIYGKTNALAAVAGSLGGDAPQIVMVDEAYIDKVASIASESKHSGEADDDIDFLPVRLDLEVRGLKQTMMQGSLSATDTFEPTAYETLVSYFEKRNPESELDKIEQVADSIRSAIERNFSLSQILLCVGDERLESSPWDMVFEPRSQVRRLR